MSTEMIQPDGLGQSPGFYTATLPQHFEFMKLPVEILAMLLGEMAAGQLPLFRSLCRAFHDSVAANEHPIVSSALKNDLYRTASKLYYRPPRNTLHVDDLYQVARRCDSARNLARLLTQNHLIGLIRTSKYAGIAPNQACSVTKVAENIYPYIIGLFYFLEKYRYALATFVPDPRYTTSARTPSSQIERRLLAQYNKETVYRLCCLYSMLLKIIEQKVPRTDFITMALLLRSPLPTYGTASDASYLDILVFGGLEAFRDIIAQNSVSAAVDYILAHYSKTTPIPLPVTYNGRNYTTLVPLPKPVLPELDHQTATDTCQRLPFTDSLLDLCNASLWGHEWLLDKDAEEGKFLGYLANHEGAEPKLLC